MKDLIVTAITGITFEKILPWLDAIKKVKFAGDIAVVCYNATFDTVNKLKENGIIVYTFNEDVSNERYNYIRDFNLDREKYIHLNTFLKTLTEKYRYLILSKIDKFDSIDKIPLTVKGNSFSLIESEKTFAQSDWHKNNMIQSFGNFYFEKMKDRKIILDDIIVGEFDDMLYLFEMLYLICLNSPLHPVDSNNVSLGSSTISGLNILFQSKMYRSNCKFISNEYIK